MHKPYPDADHRAQQLCDDFDLDSTHLIAREDDDLAASVMLTPWLAWHRDPKVAGIFSQLSSPACCHEKSVFVSRLVVNRAHRRHGKIAVTLMRQCYAAAFAQRAAAGFCHTRVELLPFFLKFGWQRAGDPFLHHDSQTVQQALWIPVVDPAARELEGSPFSAQRPERQVLAESTR